MTPLTNRGRRSRHHLSTKATDTIERANVAMESMFRSRAALDATGALDALFVTSGRLQWQLDEARATIASLERRQLVGSQAESA